MKRVGEKLARLSPVLDGTSVHSGVALLYDFPTRWVMETGGWLDCPKELYIEHCQKLYSVVRLQGLNCDVVGTCSNLSHYRLLIVPALGPVDEALVDKLVGFVEEGGTLVWHPLSGIKDADANIYPDRLHPKLRDLLGVAIREFATAAGGVPIPFTWRDRRYNGRLFSDLPVLTGAESRGEFVDSWYAGTTAVAEREVGKGRIIYIMTYAEDKFYAHFFNELCKELGVRRILDADVPESIEIAERIAPDGRRLMFLLNSRDEEQTILLPPEMDGARDVYNEEDIADRATMSPFGLRILKYCS
jgi:beta-galactosidase